MKKYYSPLEDGGKVDGKTAIVTGASGNLGQAVIKKFIDEGYFVIGTVIPNDKVPIDFSADKFEKIVVEYRVSVQIIIFVRLIVCN